MNVVGDGQAAGMVANKSRVTPGGADDSRVVQAGEVRSARIESLRALAALGVLWGHVYGYAHGFRADETLATFFQRAMLGGGFGVYLFFALSGYLIYWPFARRDFGGGGAIDYARYGINRAVRILPLYWISVIIVLAAAGATVTQWWRFMLFSENYFSDTVGQLNGVIWSVVVELHFYVLLPFIAYGIARIARQSRIRGATAIGTLAAVSLFVWYLKVFRENEASIWRFNIAATFFFFTGGMLVAVLRTSWDERRPQWLRGAVASSDFWFLASLPLWVLVIWRYHYVFLLPLPCAIWVGACVLPLRPGFFTRALEWRPLALIGIASYSLYIWHIPILDALTDSSFVPVSWVPSGTVGLAIVAVPLSLAAALASYALIESPFLRMRRRWSSSSAQTEVGVGPARTRPAVAPPAGSPPALIRQTADDP